MSLRSRVLGHLDASVSPFYLRKLYRAAHQLASSIGPVTDRMSFEAWLASCPAYTNARRNILRAARSRADLAGLSKSHSRIQAFLKFEKLTSEGDPRVIQPTTDEYLTVLGPLIKPLDKALGARYEFTKGLNYTQLGDLFTQHVNLYKDPVCISVDYSRFDAHVSSDLLRVEHYVYCLLSDDALLATLLAWQVDTCGKTRSGFEYFRSGGRCSGHPNTSCGNAILNLLMHRVVLHGIGVRASTFVNGDDALLILERQDAALWRPDLYVPFGMAIEGSVTDLPWAEYCSGRFMPRGGRYVFVRDLPKALLKLPWALKKITATEAALRRHDVLHAELSQQPAVPLFSAFCRYHHDLEPCREPARAALSWHMQEFDLSMPTDFTICPESRQWFSCVYGIDASRQVAAEAVILSSGWSEELTMLARAGFQPLVDARETHGSIFHHWNLTYCPSIDQECHHGENEGCSLAQHSCCRDSSFGPCWDYSGVPELPRASLQRAATSGPRGPRPASEEAATSPWYSPGGPATALPKKNGAWVTYCAESNASRCAKRLGHDRR